MLKKNLKHFFFYTVAHMQHSISSFLQKYIYFYFFLFCFSGKGDNVKLPDRNFGELCKDGSAFPFDRGKCQKKRQASGLQVGH